MTNLAFLTPYLAEAGLFLLAAFTAGTWAAFDLLTTFTDDFHLIRKNAWAWIYVSGHGLIAGVLYLVFRPYLAASLSPLLGAFLVGLSWQTLLRMRIQVLRALDDGEGESVDLAPLDALFRRFQELCRLHLDRALMRRRSQLVRRLTQQPIDWLEKQARVMIAASQLEDPRVGWSNLPQLKKELGEELWPWYLAYSLLRRGGEQWVEDLLNHETASPKKEASHATHD